VAFWKDRLEDDGAVHSTQTALRRVADSVVSDALLGLRRAFLAGDLHGQSRAQLVLELARLLRIDLQGGAWDRLDAADRRRLRRALLVLGLIARSHAAIPLG
jgi:hypothetical protein